MIGTLKLATLLQIWYGCVIFFAAVTLTLNSTDVVVSETDGSFQVPLIALTPFDRNFSTSIASLEVTATGMLVADSSWGQGE